jgi:3',5'-cyclic AMP phosphodiesterase CpdA
MRRATNLLRILLFALALAVSPSPGLLHAWSFAFTSDSHDDRTGVFLRILAAVDRSDMEFLIHGGDMVNRNRPEEWDRFRKAAASLRKPLHPVIGNHELNGGRSRENFAKRFGLPGTSYSFTHKDARFSILDNAEGSLPDTVLSRLDRDLAVHRKGKDGIDFLIVAMHIPPANGGIAPHGTRPGYVDQSGKLLRILKKHGVDAVLCGHEHMNLAEDWEGIPVIVSAVAPFPLFPLQWGGFFRIDLEDGRVRWTFMKVAEKE